MLIQEAVARALHKTRRMSRKSVGRYWIIKGIVADYNGLTISGGRRFRFSEPMLRRFMSSVRKGGCGAWKFLNFRHHRGPRGRGLAQAELERAIFFAALLTGRTKARTGNEVRAALLFLACLEIEAHERVSGITAACKLASKKYRGTDMGGGMRLGFAWQTAYRNYRRWLACQRSLEAFRLCSRRQAVLVPSGIPTQEVEKLKLN